MASEHRVHHTQRGELRRRVYESRQARSQLQRGDDDRARAELVLELLSQLAPAGCVVACYLSAGVEPGTLGLLPSLLNRYRVLVPDLRRAASEHGVPYPNWAWLGDISELADGPFGIPSPTNPGLGATALSGANVIIAAAVMAGEDGSRLGTGGGWYDRALGHAAVDAPVIVLLNDDEIAPCPMADHDRYIDWLVTPTRIVRASAKQ